MFKVWHLTALKRSCYVCFHLHTAIKDLQDLIFKNHITTSLQRLFSPSVWAPPERPRRCWWSSKVKCTNTVHSYCGNISVMFLRNKVTTPGSLPHNDMKTWCRSVPTTVPMLISLLLSFKINVRSTWRLVCFALISIILWGYWSWWAARLSHWASSGGTGLSRVRYVVPCYSDVM